MPPRRCPPLAEREVRRRTSLVSRVNPFRRASPQRVAMFGAEETEMTDLCHAGVGGGDGEDFRLDRATARAKQFDRSSRRPGNAGQAQRAHRSVKFRKMLQRLEAGIVEQIAFA